MSTTVLHTCAPTSGGIRHISLSSLTIGKVSGTMYSIGSRWMDSELFQTWFYNDFLELVHTKKRPLLLRLDGHWT